MRLMVADEGKEWQRESRGLLNSEKNKREPWGNLKVESIFQK